MDKATANTGCANTPDAVNHPAHYTAGGIECIDAITAALSCQKDPTAAWLTGQVIKYLWRWPLKNGADILQIHAFRKLHDLLHGEQLPILRLLDSLVFKSLLQQGLFILPDTDNIGVVAHNMDIRSLCSGLQIHLQIKRIV